MGAMRQCIRSLVTTLLVCLLIQGCVYSRTKFDQASSSSSSAPLPSPSPPPSPVPLSNPPSDVSGGTTTGDVGTATPPPSVPPSCIPTTQDAACRDKNCGSVDDGCASTLLCGACTRTGETCGGSGTPNVCGGLPPPPTPPAGMTALCTPATRDVACHDQDCGSVPDGCGSTLDCGNCAAPAVCDTGHT